MTTSGFEKRHQQGCVIALHCSLGSGRQWSKLTETLGSEYQVIAPDIAGYGGPLGSAALPMTLADEIVHLGKSLSSARGPLHLVGHSYGGAIAFKIATDSPLADRVRSLTLIEPVLPTLLRENPADRRLHDLFAQLARNVSADLWNGMYMEAIDRFLSYWNGSGPAEPLKSGPSRYEWRARRDKITQRKGKCDVRRRYGS